MLKLKPNQVRIRLYADDEEVVKRIAEETRLSSTDVVSMILHAALRSIDENGGHFSLPLRFTMTDSVPVDGARVKTKKRTRNERQTRIV